MKIALVNLCKIEDYSQTSQYEPSLRFLEQNGLDFVDYTKGRSTESQLLEGFHSALQDETVELVWFVQGGNKLIGMLDSIDWSLVQKNKKRYLGFSDYTYFAMKAALLGVECFYGPALKRIYDYYPSEEARAPLTSFLKNDVFNEGTLQPLVNAQPAALNELHLYGGYLLTNIALIPTLKPDLRTRSLFIEHHYIPGESISDANYYVEILKNILKHNLPKNIVLGHTFLHSQDGGAIPVEQINKQFANTLADLRVPVYYVDHFACVLRISG